MLAGPVEWTEVTLAPRACKTNLLREAYHAPLQMAALAHEGSVVVTKFANGSDDDNATPRFVYDEIMERPIDHLRLHERSNAASTASSEYQCVAWSSGTTQSSLLAIARDAHLEIWTFARDDTHIRASLATSVTAAHNVRGVAWHPVVDQLLIYSEHELMWANDLSRALVVLPPERRQAWKVCSWSPDGLALTAVTTSTVYELSWRSIDDLIALAAPTVDVLELREQLPHAASAAGTNALAPSKFGSIAAVVRVAPTVCVLTTDTPLILQDVVSDLAFALAPAEAPADTVRIRDVATCVDRSLLSIHDTTNAPPISASALLLERVSSASKSSSTAAAAADDTVVDLTSLRVTASSNATSSLQILSRPDPVQATATRDEPLRPRPASHVLLLTRYATRNSSATWHVASSVVLPNLPTPDVLTVQDARVIVGSTLTHCIAVVQSTKYESDWELTISGELELPPTQVCRGLFVGTRSPFLQVASAEKVKKTVFFHAAAPGPQRLLLSKFKLPRRAQTARANVRSAADRLHAVSATAASESVADTAAAGATASVAASDATSSRADMSGSLLATIAAQLESMQREMHARFDSVQTALEHLSARVAELEYKQKQ